jgi:hypothetical protein
MTGPVRRVLSLALLLVLPLVIGSCSDDDDDENPEGGTRRVTVGLEGAVQNIRVEPDQPAEFIFTFQLPPSVGVVEALELDIEGSMRHVRVEDVSLLDAILGLFTRSDLLGEQTAQAVMRVGVDPGTVCSEGTLYGPFNLTMTTSPQVTPDSADATPGTVQLINTGAMIVCVTVTSTVGALFSVDSLDVEFTEGTCQPAADFEGTWTGEYTCGNSCDQPFGGDIEITVDQNGTNATYTDDGGSTFSGRVCGNMFRFERRTAFEIERGTLTLDSENTATKISTWRSTAPPYCGGDCVDHLVRDTD